MSISLATKGIISQVAFGGSYPVYVYVPIDEPGVEGERLGDKSMFPTSLEAKTRGKTLQPAVKAEELKPKMKAES